MSCDLRCPLLAASRLPVAQLDLYVAVYVTSVLQYRMERYSTVSLQYTSSGVYRVARRKSSENLGFSAATSAPSHETSARTHRRARRTARPHTRSTWPARCRRERSPSRSASRRCESRAARVASLAAAAFPTPPRAARKSLGDGGAAYSLQSRFPPATRRDLSAVPRVASAVASRRGRARTRRGVGNENPSRGRARARRASARARRSVGVAPTRFFRVVTSSSTSARSLARSPSRDLSVNLSFEPRPEGAARARRANPNPNPNTLP